MSTFIFELATGNEGVKTIVNPLLSTEDVAEQRARYEFMENGYEKKYITFDTYRTDLIVNNIILVKGLKYKVTDISISSNKTKMKTTVKGVRYE